MEQEEIKLLEYVKKKQLKRKIKQKNYLDVQMVQEEINLQRNVNQNKFNYNSFSINNTLSFISIL